MASTLTITIPEALADEVRAAAEARGLSPEDYVLIVVAEDIELEQELAAELESGARGAADPGADDAAFAEMMARLEARKTK